MPNATPRSPKIVAFATSVVLMGWSTTALAETPYPTSNEAAISGGAVLAAGREVGSLYYNPASLAHVHRGETELTAEAFGARWTQAPQGAAIEDASGNVQARALQSREFLIVPSSLAMGFALSPRWTLGAGLFLPVLGDMDLLDKDGADDPYVRSRRTAQRYEFALAVGWDAHPSWKLGLSTTGVVDTLRVRERVFTESTASGSASFDREVTTTTVGLRPKVGVQTKLSRLVSLGATFETPTFVLSRERAGVFGLTRNVDGEPVTDFSRIADEGIDDGPLTGWRSALGLSVGKEEWRVSSDVYGEAPGRGPSPLSWGVRLGARGLVSERISVGGGIFTDQNIESDAGPLAFRGDRWGGALGVEFRKPVRLAAGESARTIEFRTTLAARYAYEVGTIGGLRIEEGVTRGEVDVRGPATAHLLFLHLGTTLAF